MHKNVENKHEETGNRSWTTTKTHLSVPCLFLGLVSKPRRQVQSRGRFRLRLIVVLRCLSCLPMYALGRAHEEEKKKPLVVKTKQKQMNGFATSLLHIVFQRTPCQFCLLKQGALLCRKPTQNFKWNRARIRRLPFVLLFSAAPVCFDVMWSKDERCTRGRVCVALK